MKLRPPSPPARTPGKDRGRTLTPEGVTDGGYIDFTLAEYAALPDNFFQRGIKERLKKNRLIRTFDIMHADVVVCRFKGKLYKVDGHTRCYVWMNGLSDRTPEVIHARVWNCATREDVKWCYDHYDNQAAVETSSDKLAGAMRSNEVVFNTDWLNKHAFFSALWYAQAFWVDVGRKQDPHDLFAAWLDELKLFDRCSPTPDMWQVPYMAGALIALRVYGEPAVGYFTQYQQQAGTTTRGLADAIQVLLNHHEVNKKAMGNTARFEIARTMVNGCKAYIDGKRFAPGEKLLMMPKNVWKKWLADARDRLKK